MINPVVIVLGGILSWLLIGAVLALITEQINPGSEDYFAEDSFIAFILTWPVVCIPIIALAYRERIRSRKQRQQLLLRDSKLLMDVERSQRVLELRKAEQELEQFLNTKDTL